MIPEQTPIDQFQKMWEHGEDVHQWGGANTPSETLLWKNGFPRQLKDMLAIGHLLELPALIVGTHTSKSVSLPVTMFRANILGEEVVYFVVRDNFHDLKLVVGSSMPVIMPYSTVHKLLTEEELDAEKKRSYEYCKTSRDFDPAKYETDEWFRSWSSSTLLRHDGKIYRCGTTNSVYYEGMSNAGVPSEAFQRYEDNRPLFAVEVNGGVVELLRVMRSVLDAVQHEVHERRRAAYEAERASRAK